MANGFLFPLASAPLPWAGLRAGYEVRCDSQRLSLDGNRLGGYAVSNLHLSTEAVSDKDSPRGDSTSYPVGFVKEEA